MIRAKQGPNAEHGFRVPFGPYVVPGLSIAACLYIMKDLPHATFRVFFIWIAAAIATYFLYSVRHSRLNKKI